MPRRRGSFGTYGNLVVAVAGLCAVGWGLRSRAPGWCVAVMPAACAAVALEEIRYAKLLSRQRAESERLRESEMRFRNAFEEASVGMVILDIDGRVQSVNKGFTDLLHYSPAELTGKSLFDYISPEHHEDVKQQRAAILSGQIPNYRAERRFIRRDGVSVWVRSSVSMLQINNQRHTITLVEDISERKQIRDRLRKQALRDHLTGLPNRREFEQVLDVALTVARGDEIRHQMNGADRMPRGSEVALLYIDLDRFKLINDTLGHRYGDLLLKYVAHRFRDCLEADQFLARVGGDEFTVVLSGVERRDVPANVAKRLLESFRDPFEIDGHEISISATIGISRYPLDGKDGSSLLQSADAAMYAAKHSGHRRFMFFTAAMRAAAHDKLSIESHLRRALDNREISVHFQPQYELATDRLVRFEALCRWFSPVLGQVPPDRFIPVAEETGLIHSLGSYILRESCVQALHWQAGDPVQVAVNVSAVQFARADFVKSVIDILRATGLKPALLELEITESAFIRDREDGIRKMEQLKHLGVRISIDDFGTGYSSLSYLQHMPLDSLKIDRSFTAKLGSSPTALSMVRAIIAMARALGLRIVTEGVENNTQVELLRVLGTDDVQGYYFGRPEDAAATLERVSRQTTVLQNETAPMAQDLAAIHAATSHAAPVVEERVPLSGVPQLQ